jgi:hypothetical protein
MTFLQNRQRRLIREPSMIDRSFASFVHDFDAGLTRAILYLGAIAH